MNIGFFLGLIERDLVKNPIVFWAVTIGLVLEGSELMGKVISLHDINKSYRILVTSPCRNNIGRLVISFQTVSWPIGFIIFLKAGRMNNMHLLQPMKYVYIAPAFLSC